MCLLYLYVFFLIIMLLLFFCQAHLCMIMCHTDELALPSNTGNKTAGWDVNWTCSHIFWQRQHWCCDLINKNCPSEAASENKMKSNDPISPGSNNCVFVTAKDENHKLKSNFPPGAVTPTKQQGSNSKQVNSHSFIMPMSMQRLRRQAWQWRRLSLVMVQLPLNGQVKEALRFILRLQEIKVKHLRGVEGGGFVRRLCNFHLRKTLYTYILTTL